MGLGREESRAELGLSQQCPSSAGPAAGTVTPHRSCPSSSATSLAGHVPAPPLALPEELWSSRDNVPVINLLQQPEGLTGSRTKDNFLEKVDLFVPL